MIDLLLSEYSGYTKKTLIKELTFDEIKILAGKIIKRKNAEYAALANVIYMSAGSAFAGVMATKKGAADRAYQRFRKFVNSLTGEKIEMKSIAEIIGREKENGTKK